MSANYTSIAFFLVLFASMVDAARFFLPREEVLAMLETAEDRLYFYSCDMSSLSPPCAFAMDGIDSTELTQCAVTSLDDLGGTHYWLGILENPAYITSVSILNMDSNHWTFADALQRMAIFIMDEACIRTSSNNGSFAKRTVTCDQIGDEIQILGELAHSVMAICEVEVYGVYLKFPSTLGGFNFLEPKACAMSSGSTFDCYSAIDNETDISKHVVAMSQPPLEESQVAWFELYLATPSIINRVMIYSNQLAGFEVTVNRRLCTKFKPKPGKPNPMPWRVFCKYFGDSVRIDHQANPGAQVCVKLAEVQAFGYEAAIKRVDKYVPLGCHKDQAEDRDLSQLVSGTRMTSNKCYRMCKRESMKYFGLQDGKLCFCGVSFGKHGKVGMESCNTHVMGISALFAVDRCTTACLKFNEYCLYSGSV